MNIRTGVDIIEIDRIKEAIEKYGNNFLNIIFKKNEIEYCEKHKGQKYQHYAARFAVKEAVFKALRGYYTECKWKEYEVLNDEKGRPFVNIHNDKINLTSCDVSISHCKGYAVANFVTIIM